MKIMALVRAVALAAVVAGSAMPVLAQSPDDEVKAAYAAWDSAFNASDAKAIGGAYTDDALFLPPNHEVIEGSAGVAKFFGGLFAAGVTGHKLELIEADEDGDLIVAAAKWSATGKDTSGAAQPLGGIATHVFERQGDGALKLRLHTFN